jgi:flagellar biosynthesis/type III secretory pathway protein FliH
VSYDLEQLEPSDPPPRDAPARLLAQATAEAGRIRDAARAEGHAAGHAEGWEEGREEVASCAQALGEALAGVLALREEVAAAVERDAIELGVALAGKILAGSLQARPELVVEVVQGALRRVAGQRTITVLLNPSDLDCVSSALGEARTRAGAGDICDLQADQRVETGGAVVRTAEGEVDARVETQLERAREVVFAELSGGGRSS